METPYAPVRRGRAACAERVARRHSHEVPIVVSRRRTSTGCR